MNNRGQITVFIVIGVILLLSLGIYLSVTSPKDEFAPQIIEAPEAAKPVQRFIEGCMNSVAEDGLRLLGSQGGYTDTSRFKGDRYDPTAGNAVYVEPLSNFLVPYWYHMASNNRCEKQGKCEFFSERPELTKAGGPNSIERQLEIYIDKNLKDCLKGFRDFPNMKVEEQTRPISEVIIAERAVNIILNYEIDVIKQDKTYRLEKFFVPIDLNLKEIYQLANEILNIQTEHDFFAKHIINLLSMYGDLDKNSIPPFEGTELRYGQGTIWVKSKVKQDLQNHIIPQTALLRVFGTLNGNPIYTTGLGAEVKDVLYNRGMLVPGNITHPNLLVNFDYLPWWETYFDLNCDGELCTSEGISSNFMLIFGVQRYQFAYDLSFPIMIELYNPFAFEDRGYSFRFFTEANIRNNAPLNARYEELDMNFTPPFVENMFCDVERRDSEVVTVTVQDSFGRKIADTSINYVCGDDACAIGQTDDKGVLEAQFPRCIGGLIEAKNVDYAPEFQFFDTESDTPQATTITLQKYKFIDVEVRTVPVRKGSKFGVWKLDLEGETLYPRDTEEFIFLLQKQVPGYAEPDLFFADVVGGPFTRTNPCDDNPLQDASKNIRISPGTYTGQIIGISHADIFIPAETRLMKDMGPLFGGKLEADFPEVRFGCDQPLPITLGEFTLKVSAEDLRGAKKIIFYVVKWDLEGTPEEYRIVEDLRQLGILKNYTYEFRDILIPVIKK